MVSYHQLGFNIDKNKTTNKIIIGSAISMCSVDQLIPPFEVSKKDKTNDKTAAKI
jgi:hypothetical protein